MATPPSSLPSPTPSSSSHSHFQSLSGFQPSRAPSAASGISFSSASGRDMGMKHYGTQNMNGDLYSPAGYGDYSQNGAQPQMPNPHMPYSSNVPPSFLPSVTSSPPPHPPPYVPPPQHAMAPDPIHSLSPGGAPAIMGMSQPFPGPGGPAPWQNGPGPNGWRGPINQAGYLGSSQPQPQPQLPYGRSGLPNGHAPGKGLMHSHQPPSNHVDNHGPGGARGPLAGGGALAGIGGSGPGPRPGSSHGENRERRREPRDRERRDHKEDDKDDEEIISTIFVVGFPDDMPEREFQNIFTFAPGFEAATLKYPSGSSRREPTASLLAELTQLAANQAQAAAAAAEQGLEYPAPQPGLEEAMAAMTMAANSGVSATASTSASTTPSAAMSLTPSVPSGPMLGNSALLPTRRQTIGFARFKTRADALAARELLQGKKIDALTGATLKAEMAKKNLHTKRATSGEELVGLLLRSGRLAGLVNPGPGPGPGGLASTGPTSNAMSPGGSGLTGGVGIGPSSQSLPSQPPPSAREAWDAWPNSAPTAMSERERQSFEESRAMPPPQSSAHGLSSSSSGGNGILASSDRSGSISGSGPGYGSSGQNQSQQSISGQSTSQPTQNYAPSAAQPNQSTSPSLSVTSPNPRPTDSKALLALAEEADEMEGWSVNAVGMGMMDGYQNISSRRAPPGPSAQGYPPGPQGGYGGPPSNPGSGPGLGMGLGMGGYGLRGAPQQEGYNSSPPGGLGGPGGDLSTGLLGGSNPADQNPPINTLYVGNLPAVSPPTHPPNFLEESLRSLFARCQGFKRMSFRQKINGPMCFVEFDEVPFASQAIKDLYGHNLGGLVKGGIRLSYSKNSLGQRGNGHPSGINTGLFGGIAHTVALAGMSMSMTSPTTANAQPIPIAGTGNGNGNGSSYGNSVGNGSGSDNPIQGPMSAAPGGPGYGLQLQQGVGGGRGDSAPATAIPDLRRDRESSSNGVSLNHSASSQGQAQNLSTSLSPTAQPFNISLPNTAAASPRSRYFSVSGSSTKLPSPSDLAAGSGGGLGSGAGLGLSASYGSSGPSSAIAVPIPVAGGVNNPHSSTTSTFHPFGQPPSTSNSSGPTSSGFSPMSSPIRTPASFSWKSSGPTPGTSIHGSSIGNGPSVGGGGFGYEFGGGHVQLASLNGAASAWGERRD